MSARLREWARGDGGERAQRAQPVGMTELVDGLVVVVHHQAAAGRARDHVDLACGAVVCLVEHDLVRVRVRVAVRVSVRVSVVIRVRVRIRISVSVSVRVRVRYPMCQGS